MKFSSTTLALSLVLGAITSSTAFVTPSSQRQTVLAPHASALNMVATTEVVSGEEVIKPRKTREVCLAKKRLMMTYIL